MTLDEKIGQMTQAEQHQLDRPEATSRPTSWARSSPAATRTRRPTACRTGRTSTTACRRSALKTRLAHPAPLRRRRRARPQQRARRGRLPAQHRPGRHAQREAGGGDRRASPRREVRATGHPVDVRALRGRRARRALGPHLRELLRGPGSWWPSWARPRCAGCRAPTSRPRSACSACAKHFVGRRRHGLRHRHGPIEDAPGQDAPARPGRHAARRGGAAPPAPARAT